MKNKLKIIITVIASITALGFFLTAGVVHAGGKTGKYECTVGTDKDLYNSSDGSIRLMENLFNRGGSYQACRNRIDFDTSAIESGITLQAPIVLQETSPATTFIFGPDDPPEGAIGTDAEDGYVVFNLDGNDFDYDDPRTEASKQMHDGVPCAIRIVVDDTLIQNIYIKGNPASWDNRIHGLCIDASNVEIRNVIVDNVKGYGIVLGEDATNIKFTGTRGKVMNNEIGIYKAGPWVTGRKMNIEGVNLEEVAIESEKDCDGEWVQVMGCDIDPTITDEEQCIDAGGEMVVVGGRCENATTERFAFFQNSKGEGTSRNLYVPGVAAFVNLSYGLSYFPISDTEYMIQGTVVDTNCDAMDAACSEENPATPVQIQSLLIFSEPKSMESKFDVNEGGSFIRAATEQEILGGVHNQGEFLITLDTTGIASTEIFLVPVINGGHVASSSLTFPLGTSDTTGYNPLGDHIYTGKGGLQFMAFRNAAECNQALGPYIPFTQYMIDTDQDGLYDLFEMRIGKDGKILTDADGNIRTSCNCYETLTCWNNTDSDEDGIPDGNELKCADGSSVVQKDFFFTPGDENLRRRNARCIKRDKKFALIMNTA